MILNSKCSNGLVIDTNVMCHSEQQASAYHESAIALLIWLKDHSDISLMLDDQGKSAPELSTSVLASEYRASLGPQSFALNLFTTLLASGRVAFSVRPDRTERAVIVALLPSNKPDRAVLGAAVGCNDKVLVSNDYSDFTSEVRRACSDRLKVEVLDSTEAVA